MWSSWSRAVHLLPVELVGPVPETAYIPPPPGEPERFPRHGVPGAPPSIPRDAPMAPQRFPTPFTPHFVSEEPSPAPPGTSNLPPSRVGTTTPPPPRAGWMERSGAYEGFPDGPWAGVGPAGPPEGAAPMDWIAFEALTPIPPHLRAPPPLPTPEPAARPPTRADPGDGTLYCASCLDRIEDPAVWRRCPDCYRPICPECIVTALVEQGRGWCESCAGARIEAEQHIAS
jgi:hypothetical protein